jgi:gamma-glutamylcyclotransferase (GGCT)/AIG2-like uncharacterized protein YtfP
MKLNARVFVYGTLRRDEINHHLLRDANFCGCHTTAPHYSMVNLGSYPGVVKQGRTAIQGEVYEVDAGIMAALDRLEGYPTAYSRELIQTPWGRAWIYIYRGSRNGRKTISSGVWHDQIHYRRWSR